MQAATEPPTYADLGIDKTQAHRWQKIADIPEERFEQHIAETKEAHEELTTAGTLRVAAGQSVHFSSDSDVWRTPRAVIECVVRVLGTIDLDPCTEPGTPGVPARTHYTEADDGLSKPWSGRVYMNPPYGRTIGDWVEKLCAGHESGAVSEAIALVPSRTDTEWFTRLRVYPRCFIRGRLHFNDSPAGAPFPSMMVYLGENIEAFVAKTAGLGDCYVLTTI